MELEESNALISNYTAKLLYSKQYGIKTDIYINATGWKAIKSHKMPFAVTWIDIIILSEVIQINTNNI